MSNVLRFPKRLTPAQQALVAQNMSLVEVVAKDFASKPGGWLPMDEMQALGREGLVEAAISFSTEHKVAFRTFAWHRVYGAIRDGVRQDARHTAIEQALRRGLDDFATTPRSEGSPSDSDDAMHERIDVTATHALDSMVVAIGCAKTCTPEDRYLEEELRHGIAEALGHLPGNYRKVLESRYVEERGMDEVANDLRVSLATTRRWQQEAVERLRPLLEGVGTMQRAARHAG